MMDNLPVPQRITVTEVYMNKMAAGMGASAVGCCPVQDRALLGSTCPCFSVVTGISRSRKGALQSLAAVADVGQHHPRGAPGRSDGAPGMQVGGGSSTCGDGP